ncbi:B3 domain-containing protein REM9-like [Helianthus annuus]|uniref:B3 domain-containing protein REM9-like n=1 Tax=Helianthus annuus TaxID=4232 RepID=UPI000B8F531A|nr:B3 domain-containing protein REM9-like [Helianthus annuus]
MAHAFFKILRDPSAPRLSLPPDFVREYLKNNIPTGPVIISASGGHAWIVKIKKIGDHHYFTNGWKNVVKDIPLVYENFLIFRLVNPYTFDMTIFGKNGCEQILPPKSEDDDHEDVSGEFENVVDEDDKDGEEEEDHDDDCYVDDKDGEEEEDHDDDCYVDDDPFFVMTFTKSHIRRLRFPGKFAEWAGINGEGTMRVKNLDGAEWVTKVKLDTTFKTKRYLLSSGWRSFWHENNLSQGDECVFKFIRSERKLLLAKVTKKKLKKRHGY